MNNRLVTLVLSTESHWAALALRLPVGIIFMAHGAQKLFGWFGGYGLEGTGQFMESIGLHPGYQMAMLSGGAEFFGGLALIVGFLVRPVWKRRRVGKRLLRKRHCPDQGVPSP